MGFARIVNREITKEDLNRLEELRKAISKKTLSDYGYSMSV